MKYLQQCLPDVEFIYTAYTDEPYFASETPALIYMGAMSESAQEKVITKLIPYKERLISLIESDVPMLFTNNALEIFGSHIENEDGSRIEALGIYPFYAKRDMMHRFNCLLRGHFENIEIIGFKTQFTFAYGQTDVHPFIHVDRGVGMNKETTNEGIHDHNFFGTYLVGPFLILNPLFTKHLMQNIMGFPDAKLAYEDVIMKAYERRLSEFRNPSTDFN
jgi:CobQ-like glutamine amidotransferase family enzyme